MPKRDMLHVASVPAPGGKLTPAKWREVEEFLEQWKRDVLEAARRYPAKSYAEGRGQVQAFVELLQNLNTAADPFEGRHGPTLRLARYWAERYTFRELEDELNAYVGQVKDAVLYGLHGAMNPVTVASQLYHATKDAEVNWRRIARTEMIRAMSAGRLRAAEDMGYDRVWCPPHVGACKSCVRLIENKVFPIAQVRDATNFGRQMKDWIPCIPLHPHCRHAWLPYEPEVVDAAIAEYEKLQAAGLTEADRIDELFDSSGQLRPGKEDELDSVFRTRQDLDDLFTGVLAAEVEKTRTRRVVAKAEKQRRTRNLKIDDLRTDTYQRAPDPERVDHFARLYLEGDQVGEPTISKREDGTLWIVDGQHRVLGAAKAGRAYITSDVCTGLSWEDEARMCREALGERPTRPPANPFAANLRRRLEVGKASEEGTDAARLERARTGKGRPEYALGGQTLVQLHAASKRSDSKALRAAREAIIQKLPPLVPGRDVTVHRAHHPDDPNGNGLRPGDYVTLDRDRAADVFPGAPIHSQSVPPEHVTWAGSDEHEFVYCPPDGEPEVAKGPFTPHADHGTSWPSHINSEDALRDHLTSQSAKHGGAWAADNTFGAGKQYHYANRSSVPDHFMGERHHHDGLAVNGAWKPWTESARIREQNRGVSKGYFDNPQDGLDPALWQEDDRLRDDVYDRVTRWATGVLGDGWQRWAHLYLTGGATSRQWLAHPERDSDVDLQIVVDWPVLRRERKAWRKLSDFDLHYALVATIRAALATPTEVMPGIRLDAFIRPEHTPADYTLSAQRAGQPVWDVLDQRWITRGHVAPGEEAYGDPFMEGIGGALALAHPDWLAAAREATQHLQTLLDRYLEEPTTRRARRLRDAYKLIHDGRQHGYEDNGEASLGNFIWQFAVDFGPLIPVKHLLFDTELGKVWPDYAIDDLEKAGEREHIGYAHPITVRPLCHDCAPKVGDTARMQRMMGKPGGSVVANCSKCHKPLTPRAVGKMSPTAAPGTGVEHWITVHPHGDSEPGQPVLVRNNADGSMTVMGGAGGSLNYLRLDPKRRIDDKKSKVHGDAEGQKLTAEQPITEEEQKQQEAEFEKRKNDARKVIEKVEQKRQGIQQQLRDYAASIGYNVEQARVVHTGTGEEDLADASKTEQRDALRRLQKAALHTLAYGEISRKDADESGYLIERREGDFEGMPESEQKPDEPELHEPADDNGDTQEPPEDVNSTPEGDLERERRRMPKLPPLTKEQAQTIMRLERQIARAGRQQTKARKVLREGGEHQDSLALDWRDADVDADVAKRVAAEQKTDVARQLLETAENPKENPGRVRYQRALHQGAYDSIDAFSHAVLGVSAIPPGVARLLGPAGTAQLAAYAIRKRAADEGLDMQQALDALDTHTQKQELEVANTALARARDAADLAVHMREERKLSEAGDSLWLQSMTRSWEQEKMGEAARLLGMGIGGMEAASAMKVALDSPADKLKVTGFENAASIKELGRKAGLAINDADISRVGAGNYTLSMEPERLEHLLKFDPPPNTELRDRLRKLRTPGELEGTVEKARDTPGMSDTLDPMQARGKLVLTATAQAGGGCVLAFAPGRGKTHTALAAALQRMNDEGVPQGKGNTWIVCPTTGMAEWAGTIANNTTRTVQMVGKEFEHLGGGVVQSQRKGTRHTEGQLGSPADFNIISLEHLQTLLKKNPELADQIKASRVIADESQKAKNEKADRWKSLSAFSKHTSERWALSGTTVEKKLKDLGAQYHWANPERSLSPTQMEEKFGKLGQEPHVLGPDKVQQFREGLDEGLYQLGADDKNLPQRLPDQQHKVTLDPEHVQAMQKLVKNINETRSEARERGLQGISGIEAERMMKQALYERPHNAMARKVADIVDGMKDFDYEGDPGTGENAGTYAPKAIVFSQFVKQLDHVVDELKGGDAKVFYAHGGMSNEENDQQLKDFVAHKGRAVLVSSDKNSTARSLQFGKNKGKFQHGATTMVHYSLPDNNATIQQREARIHRKGSAVPVQYHTLNAGTPAEVRQQDRLARERRTQALAGNSEQLVGGKDTLHHLLERERKKTRAAA